MEILSPPALGGGCPPDPPPFWGPHPEHGSPSLGMSPCLPTARRGHRKPDGECQTTRLAYGDGASGERPIYTVCDNCGRVLCVDCLEPLSVWLTSWIPLPIAPSRTTCCMLWRLVRGASKREVDGRVRGFEPRRGGGGTWRAHCPLCFDVRFSKPEPPLPRTLSGRPYMDMPAPCSF